MPAYYNDTDAYAAAWLRNLIAAGLIAAGDVDERDVREVQPDDLRGYRQVHLFAGIGGWSYALRLAGWPDDRPVWTGSCPCQPFSSAGQRRGHGDQRHLWPAFHGLIAECRPAVVFGEQVASALGREWLAGVRADLEHVGYACGCADLPAACVGAPHIRQRLWWGANWLGDADSARRVSRQSTAARARHGSSAEPAGRARRLGDPEIYGDGTLGRQSGSRRAPQEPAGGSGLSRRLGDTAGHGIPCADGKARRVGQRIQWLADGVSGYLESVRAGKEEEDLDAHATKAGPNQALSAVREDDEAETIQQRNVRRHWCIPTASVLRPRLHGGEPRGRNQESDAEQLAPTVREEGGSQMRGVSIQSEAACPPSRREPTEQRSVKPADVMRLLSQALAHDSWRRELESCGVLSYLRNAFSQAGHVPKALPEIPEIWRSATDETRERIGHILCERGARWVSISPLTHGEAARVGRLRAYGNAIVPAVAAVFIEAFIGSRGGERA